MDKTRQQKALGFLVVSACRQARPFDCLDFGECPSGGFGCSSTNAKAFRNDFFNGLRVAEGLRRCACFQFLAVSACERGLPR